MAKVTYTLPQGFSYRSLTVLNGTFYALRSGRSGYDILPIPGL